MHTPNRLFGPRPCAAIAIAFCSAALAAPADIDLPAQPLDSAIKAIAKLYGLNVVMDGNLADGRLAPAVKGRLDPDDALRRVLAGSGLVATVQGDGSTRLVQRGRQRDSTLAPVTVTADRDVHDGYYVERQSFGPLGEVAARDLPYAANSVPRAVIESQQAKSIQDILGNDPSVSIVRGANLQNNNDQPLFNIRGFALDVPNGVRVNGISSYSVSPPPEGIERVDILKGATAVLYGFATPAGTVNTITKKPLDAPLTEIGLGYVNSSQLEVNADISRRFGVDNQFGARLNLAKERGDGPIDQSTVDRDFEALALDWKPVQGARVWTDLNHFNSDRTGLRNFLFPRFNNPPLAHIPNAPDPSKQLGQPWTYNKSDVRQYDLGAEYKSEEWTLNASYGRTHSSIQTLRYNEFLNDFENTNVTPLAINYGQESSGFSGLIARRFDWGPMRHEVSISRSQGKGSQTTGTPTSGQLLGVTNFQNPVYFPAPVGLVGGPPSQNLSNQNQTTTLSDRITIGEQWILMAGAVHAVYRNVSTPFANPASATGRTSSDTTPFGAVIFKPVKSVSIYASYIAALQQGDQAPATGVANPLVFLDPYVGKQFELGVKSEAWPGFEVGAAYFDIRQDYPFIDPADTVFKSAGTQHNRGIEFTVAGKVMRNLSVFGGLIGQRSAIESIANGVVTGPGNKALGIPEFQANLFAEYLLNDVPGLSLLGGWRHVGTIRANVVNGNYLSFPSYTLYDIGAKYQTKLGSNELTARLYIQNLTNKAYLSGLQFGNIFGVGDPRTVKLSVSMRF